MTEADETSLLRQKCQQLQAEVDRLKKPYTGNLMRFFRSAHLPPDLREISEPCEMLAALMTNRLPMSAELTTGIRKLLEAKDCFVRAALPLDDAQPATDAPKS